jgi:hypothetical protein
MMGGMAPETFWATRKRQVINLRNCCILLVDLFESNSLDSMKVNFDTEVGSRSVTKIPNKIVTEKQLINLWECGESKNTYEGE